MEPITSIDIPVEWSTDIELHVKLWDLHVYKGIVRTYKGHMNDNSGGGCVGHRNGVEYLDGHGFIHNGQSLIHVLMYMDMCGSVS